MKNGTIIYNNKTQKAAKVYQDTNKGQLVIRYLKNEKPFGPLRDVKTINFSTNKGETK